MKSKNPVYLNKLGNGVIPLFLLLLVGCSEWNDNPADNGKLFLDLSSIQRKLGILMPEKRLNEKNVIVPEDTASTTEVKALVVGALVVTSRNTPYTRDIALSGAVEESMKTDLQNSVDFFKIVRLPTADKTIMLKLPPSTAENWQPIVVGLRTVPELLENLADNNHEDSDIYYGFSSKFYKTDNINNNEIIKLTLFRNCLGDAPPKGCASFDSSIDKNPIVKASVEIIGVTYNGGTVYSSSSFPILVHQSTDETVAVTSLSSIRDQIKLLVTSVSDLTIQTTHSGNPAESAACQALYTSSSLTVEQLKAACEIQENKIKF
jgi:hypothetical protein